MTIFVISHQQKLLPWHETGFGLAPSPPWVGQSQEEKKVARAAEEIKAAISELDKAINAAGHSAEQVRRLSSQRDHLVALKSQLALGFVSGAGLRDLLQQVHAAASTATQTAGTVIAGGTIAGVGARIATEEYHRAAAESRNWLHSTAEQFEKTTNASSALAARYGIDVSEHDKKIDEARKREKDALAKGDVAGALHARIDGYDAAIDKSDQIINDPKTPDDKKKEEQRRKEELIKKREEAKAQEQKLQEKKLEEKVQKGEMTKEEKDKALSETKAIDAQKTAALQGQTVAVVDKNVAKITNNAGKIDDEKDEYKRKNPNPNASLALTSSGITVTHASPNQLSDKASLAAKAAVANIENKPVDPVAAGNEAKQPTQVVASVETKSSPKIGG